MANYFMWDYKHPDYAHSYAEADMQRDWNQTLVTKFNFIDYSLAMAEIPNTKHIIVPQKFQSIFNSLVFYEKITDNLGKLSNKFSIEFSDMDNDYINVCGVPLKIENFN